MEDFDADEQKYNELMEEFVIPKLNAVFIGLLSQYPQENPDEVMKRAMKEVFTDDIKAKFSECGIDISRDNFDISFYFMSDEDLKDNVVESMMTATDDYEKLNLIDKCINETDKYKIMETEVDNIKIEAIEMKKRLTIDDVDPISEEDFRKAFDNGN